MNQQTRPSPFLLLSPDGMLGRAFVALLRTRDIPFTGVSYPDFNIASAADIGRVVGDEFRVVINCCAFTDVDGAETREAEAHAVNAEGVRLLAARCRQTGAVLVHYSTDYVFDGKATEPYPVDAPRRPQNAYGRTKAEGEESLVASGCEHLLIRTSWLYAPWGKNFVNTIARASMSRPVLRVVADQYGRPTSAEYLAERSLGLLDAGATGIYHVTDGGACTWFDFARAIVKGVDGPARVDACTTAEYPLPAYRPAYSVLDLAATDGLIGPSRPWEFNLADVLRARAAAGD
ncbi:MAG: dTDP-4-dehydrorhamnose reductase [Acidobacteriota bacterium]